MSRLVLLYKPLQSADRWFYGDNVIRAPIRRLLRGSPRPGGIDKVFINLRKSLDILGVPYAYNIPLRSIRPSDVVCAIGRGRRVLKGYSLSNPILGGVALMTYPWEWPTLFSDVPIGSYLQHSQWCVDFYEKHFGKGTCETWPVGIDTDHWCPASRKKMKTRAVVLYEKSMWNTVTELDVQDIQSDIERCGYRCIRVRYGNYNDTSFYEVLSDASAMVFLCEHESQGLAYQQALSMNVPILALDAGIYADPEVIKRCGCGVAASSVPYFSSDCGIRAGSLPFLRETLPEFLKRAETETFNPRRYVENVLSLPVSGYRYVSLARKVAAAQRV